MTQFTYQAYGLGIASDCAIPGLSPADGMTAPDLDISLVARTSWLGSEAIGGENDWYVRPGASRGAPPSLVIRAGEGRRHYRFLYDDGTEFHVAGDGSRIWGSWQPPMTFAYSLSYLLAPVLGFVLRLRGITCLHASAAVIDGEAVAFVGASGAGKSTTAGAFATLGHPVITDDVLALGSEGDRVTVHGGYTHVRLWPTSTPMLLGTGAELPRLTEGWEKRYLDLTEPGRSFEAGPVPLAALYVLAPRGDDEMAHRVTAVGGAEAIITLVGHAYMHSSLAADVRADELRRLAQVAATVPVRRITPHRDPGRIWDLCQAVVDDVRLSRARAAPTAGAAR